MAKSKQVWPDYINEALVAFKPPERLKVSEWADKYRILDDKSSNDAGPWKTEKTPYLREIMDDFSTPGIEEIVMCFGAQVGKTETLYNDLCYAVDQDPSPTMIVYPTLELADSISQNRLQPMFLLQPRLAAKYRVGDSKNRELQFDGMYLVISGSNSPSSLSSRPIRYLFADELDKWPTDNEKEGDPLSLAKVRTRTFNNNRKIVMCSTPTTELGYIWQEYKSADVRKQFHVPCPHCGLKQVLKTSQIKWPERSTPEEIRDSAWYECEHCKGQILDRHKHQLLRSGEWVAENKPNGRVRKVGYQLSSLYSPWLRWGEIAEEWIKSKDFPERLKTFVNSTEGLPWVERTVNVSANDVLLKVDDYIAGQVPEDAFCLTGGIDVQDGYLMYTIRAWGPQATSWLVRYGRAETLDELEAIMLYQTYSSKSGGKYLVAMTGVDSGYETDSVYQWCLKHPDRLVPTKGASQSLLGAYYRASKIDKGPGRGLTLYLLDTNKLKDMIFGRLKMQVGAVGSWHVYADCPEEYARHIVSEQRQATFDKKTGRPKTTWVKKGSSPNHWLDCEVNAAGIAEILGIRYIEEPPRAIAGGKRRTFSKGV